MRYDVRMGLLALFLLVPLVGVWAGGKAEEDVLYVNLVWHQHQPLYYKEGDVYSRPWVRVHATKDYYDMAAILEQYPDVHVTFNLTPVLLRQLDDFIAGAKDKYWVLGEKPAAQLTREEKRFILERFFDANHDNLIRPFPRYWELMKKRDAAGGIDRAIDLFTEQDFRDLQVWFQLAWCDPDLRAQEPLASLVKKGKGFSEEDKKILFQEISRILKEVVPVHKKLMERGQIEVITTPYAHPILPLIYSTKLMEKNDPGSPTPELFSYPNDAIAHLEKAREVYKAHFGREPVGMWPAEGSVAQEIVPLVARAGFSWMASGEQVLAKSLGLEGFTRDAHDTVEQADLLYRPYYVTGPKGEKVAIVFRDNRLSDLIGFEYSGKSGKAAVDDLMARLSRIRAKLKETGGKGPYLVSIILDGENAWEHYKNDGKEFFHELYMRLSSTPWLKTITPSEFLKKFPEQETLEELWPGCWFTPDFSTWIGEEEENRAWNLLGMVRAHLAKYDMYHYREAAPEVLEKALDYMYLAEGSDWFWWYGADQDSGVDEYFDHAFRTLLKRVYETLGDPVPAILDVPVIAERPVMESASLEAAINPMIDGKVDPAEWKGAGRFVKPGGVQAAAHAELNEVRYGVSKEGVVLGFVSRNPWDTIFADAQLEIYFQLPGSPATSVFRVGEEHPVGFPATHALVYDGTQISWYQAHEKKGWEKVPYSPVVAKTGRGLELLLPYKGLPPLETGQEVRLKAFLKGPEGVRDVLPQEGHVRAVLPDTGQTTPLLEVKDPKGDDHGPGTYTYPLDPVFAPGSFDVVEFTVKEGSEDLIFTFQMATPIANPWNSPIGLSLQTFDVYLDVIPDQGAVNFLEGRNVRAEDDVRWDYAVWVEGWNQKVLVPSDPRDPESGFAESTEVKPQVLVQAGSGKVSIRVPKRILGDARSFRVAACVLSQDGFPSAGVRRVRDVQAEAAQWRFGGAQGENPTRVIDLVWDGTPTQQEQLSRGKASFYSITRAAE